MPSERSRRILVTSGVGLAQRGAQILSTLITLPLVLQALGVAGFGMWAAATSLAWLSGVLDLGIGSALLTLIPESIAKGQSERVRAYVTASMLGGAGLCCVVLAGGFLLLWFGAARLPAAPFLLAGVALAVNIPVGIGRDLWFGLQKGYAAGVWDLLQTVLTLGLIMAAVLAGGGLLAMVAAVYGAMVLANIASLAHVMLGHEVLRPGWQVSFAALRAVLSRGSLLLVITIAATCSYSFDNIMALQWLGPVAAAQIGIALRVATTALGVMSVAAMPLWPEFVRAAALGDRVWQRRILRDGTLGLAALAVLGAGLTVAFGAPVLRWWLHRDLHISRALLCGMAAWICVMSLTRISGLLLNAVLWLRVQIVILVGTTVLGVIMKFYAAQVFGVTGILLVTPVLWAVIVTPAYFYLAWRAIDGQAGIAADEAERG